MRMKTIIHAIVVTAISALLTAPLPARSQPVPPTSGETPSPTPSGGPPIFQRPGGFPGHLTNPTHGLTNRVRSMSLVKKNGALSFSGQPALMALSWSWAPLRPTYSSRYTHAATGQFTASVPANASSAFLGQAASSGKRFASVSFVSVGVTFTFNDVTLVAATASSDQAEIVTNLTFNYGRVKIENPRGQSASSASASAPGVIGSLAFAGKPPLNVSAMNIPAVTGTAGGPDGEPTNLNSAPATFTLAFNPSAAFLAANFLDGRYEKIVLFTAGSTTYTFKRVIISALALSGTANAASANISLSFQGLQTMTH